MLGRDPLDVGTAANEAALVAQREQVVGGAAGVVEVERAAEGRVVVGEGERLEGDRAGADRGAAGAGLDVEGVFDRAVLALQRRQLIEQAPGLFLQVDGGEGGRGDRRVVGVGPVEQAVVRRGRRAGCRRSGSAAGAGAVAGRTQRDSLGPRGVGAAPRGRHPQRWRRAARGRGASLAMSGGAARAGGAGALGARHRIARPDLAGQPPASARSAAGERSSAARPGAPCPRGGERPARKRRRARHDQRDQHDQRGATDDGTRAGHFIVLLRSGAGAFWVPHRLAPRQNLSAGRRRPLFSPGGRGSIAGG